MPAYIYRCEQHGSFEIVQKMVDATWDHACPICGLGASRDVQSLVSDWVPHCDGFYRTDRKGVPGTGDKAERIAKNYEKRTGQKPPPPAPDVPRNGSDVY